MKLYGWVDDDLGTSSRRVYENLNTDYKIGVLIRPHKFERTKYLIQFQHELSILKNHFPYTLDGNLDFVKEYIDNYIIKMSKLKVFL